MGHIIAALVATVALVIRLASLRRNPRDPKAWAAAGICLGFGLAVIIGWEPVYRAIDHVSTVSNLAKILENGSALLAGFAVQALFLYLGDPERAGGRVRWRVTYLVAVLVVMVASFWAADVRVSEPADFTARYADLPEIGVYMLAYLSYLAVAVSDILRMSIRYARYTSARLRISMRLLSVGAAFGGGYVLHKVLFIGLRLAGADPPWSEPTGSQTLITISVCLICSSLVLSSAWKATDNLITWPRRSRAFRDLHPLWFTLYQADPSIALAPPHRPDQPRRAWFGVRNRLYRRCVEIGDGLLALGDLDQQVIERTRRLAADQGWEADRAQAAGEAAAVLVAIRRRKQGVVDDATRAPRLEAAAEFEDRADLDADAQRLRLISIALPTDVVQSAAPESEPSA
ncbi:MAB_1171c family putative transporter [Micromonospora sp. SH-82]|uniref:MAB_1171c family putative transporter n=1 Tax=Micromonospora sp. SH-82 TaxID=3132938 RepID=UPI003EBDBB38